MSRAILRAVKLSALLVSYRSASLARDAIADLRAEARDAGLPLEVIAVVNSEDPAEADVLRPHADQVFLPERNLGYAGGLNLGISASTGDLLLFSNPDLRFLRGSLAALVEAARDLFGAAGPVFYLDLVRRILVPHFDEPHPFVLARRRLARDPRRSRRLLRRGLSRLLALEEAARRGAVVEAPSLPGALLAVPRATLERAGPFDEGYALYFEENDWERRLRRLGGRLVTAGAAHVVHRYGRTTSAEPRATRWFSESEARYFASHFGRWGEKALAAVARGAPWPLPPPPPLRDATLRWDPRAEDVAVLLSNAPELHPFALARPEPGAASWRAPEEFLVDFVATATWTVRAVTLPSGETLAEGTLKPEAAA